MMRRICIAWLGLLLPLAAAENPEAKAWEKAEQVFRSQLFKLAEQEFAQFVQRFPMASRRPEAILLQAECRMRLGQESLQAGRSEEAERSFAAALELLSTHLPQAGAWTDHYRFLSGNVEYQRGNFQQAAAHYQALGTEFPQSPLALRAAYLEALSWFQLQDFEKAADLIGNPDRAFTRSIPQNPNDESVVEGWLLETEAHLRLKRYKPAEDRLILLQRQALPPRLAWRRADLLCRVLAGSGRLPEAVRMLESLHQAALEAGNPQLQAESHWLEATLHEEMGNLGAALNALEKMAALNLPERKRQAALKSIQVFHRQNRLDEAELKLNALLAEAPGEAGSELGRLIRGELRLKRFLAAIDPAHLQPEQPLPEPSRARLQEALADFEAISNPAAFPQAAPRAQLYRGWCFWFSGKIPESQSAFLEAARLLPFGEDQAIARFKSGDASFFQKDYTNAVVHYEKVLEEYAALPRVQSMLADQVLYQLIRASLLTGDQERSDRYMAQLLERFPESYFSEQGGLLLGQFKTREGRTQEARELFEKVLQRNASSPLEPQVRMAIARTWVRDRAWDAALQVYEAWLQKFPQHESASRVEFDRATVAGLAGRDEEAAGHFKAFLERHGRHPLAPLARMWLGDYHFRLGEGDPEQFKNAEEHYALLIKDHAGTEEAAWARLKAGTTAIARYRLPQARNYLRELIDDPKCPAPILMEAYFAYGDLLTRDDSLPDRLVQAIEVFASITRQWKDSPIAALALGRMGDCYKNMKNLEQAKLHYEQVIAHPRASTTARALARIGLSEICLQSTPPQFEEALEQVKEVVFSNSPKVDDFYRKEAALTGFRILEKQEKWEALKGFSDYLQQELPSLAAICRQKIAEAEARLKK